VGVAMMSNFDALIEEIAVRFDLGPKARSIVQELMGFIAEQPGGIDSFLDEIQKAGLAEKIASWFGSPYPWALSAREVKNALGSEFIERIAKKNSLTERFANKVLGYAIPKLIVCLEADCPVPVAAPARLRFPDPALLSAPPQFETLTFWRKQMPRFDMGGNTSAVSLLAPAAAVLVTLGLFWHTITVGSAGDQFVFQPAPIMAENAPMPPQPPAMSASRDAGILDASFTVTAGWIENLSAVVGRPNGQDVQGLAARNGFNGGGAPSQANRVWVLTLLPAAQLPQFVVAAETGRTPAKMKLAPAGLQNLAAGDFPTIIFPPNNTQVPVRGIPLLRRAAMQIKQLPSGTRVQLNGYTHGARVSTNDVKLSQQRADSVYRILVREGVSPAMLSAKGYGSADSLANIDRMAEGRSTTTEAKGGPADRRVEFRIIPPRP
jgi:OmpA-OmpF porin, OOP family